MSFLVSEEYQLEGLDLLDDLLLLGGARLVVCLSESFVCDDAMQAMTGLMFVSSLKTARLLVLKTAAAFSVGMFYTLLKETSVSLFLRQRYGGERVGEKTCEFVVLCLSEMKSLRLGRRAASLNPCCNGRWSLTAFRFFTANIHDVKDLFRDKYSDFIGNQICFYTFFEGLGVLRSGKVGKGLKDVKDVKGL